MEFVQERRIMDKQKKEPENEVGIQRSAQNKIIPPEAAVEKKKLRVPRSRTFINALKKADDIQAGEGEDIALVRSMPLNNKYLQILSPDTSMQNDETYFHNVVHLYQAQQSEHGHDTIHP